MCKIKKVLVLPDIHAPNHHIPSVRSVIKFAKVYRPDICIVIGDLCDFNSLSRFQVIKESELISLNDEVDAANEMLDMIELALPRKCEKIFLEGNHDQRPTIYRLNSWDATCKKLFGKDRLEDARVLYELDKRGWDFYEYGKCFPYGHALFSHGWFVNQYHAAKTVRRWFKTVFYGHTHQYQTHTINGMDGLPVTGMSIGTLSKFDLGYLKGVPPDWCHMMLYIDFFGDCFTPHPTTIINGKFFADGQLFQ